MELPGEPGHLGRGMRYFMSGLSSSGTVNLPFVVEILPLDCWGFAAAGFRLVVGMGYAQAVHKVEWSSMERLWATWLVLLLGSVGVVMAADSPSGAPAISFQQLDAAAEEILTDVVALGAEMAVLEESRELSPKNQLLVLVSVDPSAFFKLEAVQVKINDRTAAYHQYTEKELAALAQGGSHRLFWDDVPTGRHQLTASLFGQVPKDPDFQREATHILLSGVGRRVIELHVGTGKNQTFPELTIREWK
jgi:hypothetical protein